MQLVQTDTEELKLVWRSVERFAQQELTRHLDVLNHYPDKPLPPGILSGLRDLGLLEGALGARALCVALEALSEVAAAPAAMLLAHALGTELLRASGTAALVERAARSLGTERPLIASLLYAEPGAEPSATRLSGTNGCARLDGSLELVVNAPLASYMAVPVVAESGTSLVMVDLRASGVRVGEPLMTLGMRGCPVADVTFDAVRVEPDAVLAGPDKAPGLLRAVARRHWGPASAICAGILKGSIRTAAAYARDRYQGGKNIIEHQAVRVILADMLCDYAVARQAVDALSGSAVVDETTAASLFVRTREGAARATCDGVQLLGGNGYMEDYHQERRMRDAKQAQCLLGRTAALRQELVADWLERGVPL